MGFLSKVFGGGSNKPQKSAKPKVVKSGDWETHIAPDGTPIMFYKKGKEWLDVSQTWASPSRNYFLHWGSAGAEKDGIALTTQTEGLKIKKVDCAIIEAAIVTDEGVAYALEENGVFHTITAEKASQKSLAGDDYPDAYLLTPEVVAAAVDEGETIALMGVDLATGKNWKKSVAYEWPDGDSVDVSIELAVGGIKLTTPDGTAHLFTAKGIPLI